MVATAFQLDASKDFQIEGSGSLLAGDIIVADLLARSLASRRQRLRIDVSIASLHRSGTESFAKDQGGGLTGEQRPDGRERPGK